MRAEVWRLEQTPEHMLGVLLLDGQLVGTTLELPWRNNRPDVSCIPPGNYQCVRRKSPRFGRTFEIDFVSGRTDILFHAGNRVRDTHGCVLLGKSAGWLQEERAILSSRSAMKEFMERLENVNEFSLVVQSGKVEALI